MRKTLLAIAAAVTLAIASVAAPQPAHADGGRIAAGIIGGLAAGAILGSAFGGHRGYYYAPAPRYYYRPHCYWTRERYWNGWRWRSHRIRVCR